MVQLIKALTMTVFLLALFSFSVLAQPSAVLNLQHGDVVTAAAWNTDESAILTASEDGTARIWDTDGTLLHTLQHESPLRGAFWNIDSNQAVTYTDGGVVTIWDATSGETVQQFNEDGMSDIRGATFDAAESRLLIWSESGSAVIWTLADDHTMLLEHQNAVRVARWSADDNHILTLEDSGAAHLWDAATGEIVSDFSFDDETLGIAWNTNNTELLTWGGDDAARLWMLGDQNPQQTGTFMHRTFVRGADWNSDESQVISWGADDTVNLWDASKGDRITSFMHRDWVNGAVLNKDETRVLSWSFSDVWLWDATGPSTETPLLRLHHDSLVVGARFNADETAILSWSWDGTARVWPLEGVSS